MKYLSDLGEVRLIFQPAGEDFAGAKEMIADGCLEANSLGAAVDAIYGLHIWTCNHVTFSLYYLLLTHSFL